MRLIVYTGTYGNGDVLARTYFSATGSSRGTPLVRLGRREYVWNKTCARRTEGCSWVSPADRRPLSPARSNPHMEPNVTIDAERQRELMYLALLEGRKALPGCIPNPPVGCVLVRHERVIARGYTNPPGQNHAEAMALSLISEPLTDVTAFVTLEPCSFHGRTPSCAEALVRRRIGRVYIAILDPDPRNNGAGLNILQRAGIEVSVGLLEDLARRELGPYLARPDNARS